MRAFFIAIPVVVSVLGLGGACSGIDPSPDLCGGPVAGTGAYCDPQTPCSQSYLDCYYQPGCDKPHGTCEAWAHCNDTGMLLNFCSCDGKIVTNPNQPYAGRPISIMTCGDAGPVVDAPLDVCNDPVDGSGVYCDPSTPCAQSYLDCFYVPGCDKPHGTCERWAHCGDTGMTQFFCSCDGETVTNANHPIASTAECAGGADAASDSSDATTDGG